MLTYLPLETRDEATSYYTIYMYSLRITLTIRLFIKVCNLKINLYQANMNTMHNIMDIKTFYSCVSNYNNGFINCGAIYSLLV